MEYNGQKKSEDAVKFSDDEIKIVKRALKTKLYKTDEDDEVRVEKWQKLLSELSEQFGIPEVKFVKELGDRFGADFNRENNTIYAQRYSLVSILFAFCVALNLRRKMEEDREWDGWPYPDPLAFGLSALKQAAPRMFAVAKDAGRLMGTEVAYTDGGRIQPEPEPEEDDDDDDDIDEVPDIDPENRGNGQGEY